MMKKSRQDKILELVAAYCIDTQDELIERLRESGYEVTQATVSRDIRALNLIKVQTEQGSYRYVQPRHEGRMGGGDQSKKEPINTASHAFSITQVAYAMNNVVVKTTPGMAPAVGLFLDHTYHNMMLGSVAGDDTIIVVTRSEDDSKRLCDYLASDAE